MPVRGLYLMISGLVHYLPILLLRRPNGDLTRYQRSYLSIKLPLYVTDTRTRDLNDIINDLKTIYTSGALQWLISLNHCHMD